MNKKAEVAAALVEKLIKIKLIQHALYVYAIGSLGVLYRKNSAPKLFVVGNIL